MKGFDQHVMRGEGGRSRLRETMAAEAKQLVYPHSKSRPLQIAAPLESKTNMHMLTMLSRYSQYGSRLRAAAVTQQWVLLGWRGEEPKATE